MALDIGQFLPGSVEASQAELAAREAAYWTDLLARLEAAEASFTLPQVTVPDLPSLPDINLPDIDLPDIDIPDIDLPEIELPRPAQTQLGGVLEGLDNMIPGLDFTIWGFGIDTLDSASQIAALFPGSLSGPDSTGEVPTGGFAIGRAEAALGASLAAAPRVVEALGETAVTVELPGASYAIVERYVDPASGFSALQLRPAAGGPAVFAIDGLEVGSRPDSVAAATLGRLQLESDAFREMVGDAFQFAFGFGVPARFVGASLGGAVAQAAAYETAEALAAAGPYQTGAVRLVTVDALGGRDATEAINGGSLDPQALRLIEGLNLRDDGDLISRIGSHIGATLTLPTLDAEGNRVQLAPADAHVNVVSLLQVLRSDALYAQGVLGAPAEISGFAALSNPVSRQVVDAWRASGEVDDPTPGRLQIPGDASFDASGTVYSLDADSDGQVDLAVTLSQPVSPGTADLVL
jgi:hypothetical protein